MYVCGIFVLLTTSLSQVRSHLDDGLLAHYLLDGSAYDYSGNQNNLVVSGAVPTTDRFGRHYSAYYFDGIDDKIWSTSALNNFPNWVDSERTISVWFRSLKNDGVTVGVGSNANYGYSEQFALATLDAYITVYSSGPGMDLQFPNTGSESVLDSEAYTDGVWRHLVVTKGGANTGCKLYVNGHFAGTTPAHVYSTGITGTQNVVLGGWNDQNRFFQGDIDDVRIYDRALAQWEVQALYQKESTDWRTVSSSHLDDDLLAHYFLDGSAYDYSGYHNNLVVSGAVPTADRFGRDNSAYYFDGHNDKISWPLNNFPTLLDSERTISVWFRSLQNDGIIVAIGSTHAGTPGNEQFAIGTKNNCITLYGGISVNDFTFPNTGSESVLDSELYTNGVWRHLVVTKGGANTGCKAYVNGHFIGTTAAHAYNTGASNTQNVVLGTWNDPNRFFKGDIDDVRIYERELEQWEIQALYQKESTDSH